MLPVSLVFHTVERVKTGLTTQLEWEHPFHKIIYAPTCRIQIQPRLVRTDRTPNVAMLNGLNSR